MYIYHMSVCNLNNVWAFPLVKLSFPMLVDGVLSDRNQGITELLASLWCHLATSNILIHNISKIRSWIQVWGRWVPVNSINSPINQKLSTHSVLTMALRILFCYLVVVRVSLGSTRWFVQSSTDIPSQTITDPPLNLSCWMMLQAV